MYSIFLIVATLTTISCHKAETLDDLGILFYKHMTDSLSVTEFLQISNILQDFNPIWEFQNENQNKNKGIRCHVCRALFGALFLAISEGVPEEYVIRSAVTLCTISTRMSRVCEGVLKLNYHSIKDTGGKSRKKHEGPSEGMYLYGLMTMDLAKEIRTVAFDAPFSPNTPLGIQREVKPILKYIIQNTPEAHPNNFCALILQKNTKDRCPHKDKRFEWKVDIPPKTIEENKILNDYLNLTIALISDVHIDPLYDPSSTSSCNEPACCRSSSTKYDLNNDTHKSKVFYKSRQRQFVSRFSNISNSNNQYKRTKSYTNQAGYWGGDIKCDTPIWAYEDAVQTIASHKDLDVVYYLGDNINHFVWETTYETNIKISKLVIDTMTKHFGKNVLVVPVVGNHEAHPANQFAPPSIQDEGLNTTWLYTSLAEQWRPYLTDEAFTTMRKDGQYSMLIKPGLRVISLNKNVAYKYNWWLVHDPLNAKRHLEWLIKELHKAELAGEKVHILSHIPPGGAFLLYTWTREYKRVIDRFSSTITSQFTGHTHLDDMKLFLRGTQEEPFSMAWGAGSITNFGSGSNRNYKIVTFDETSKPKNIDCYTYNLTEANLTPNKRPRWYRLYNMKDTYQITNLSPNSINNLTYSMVTTNKPMLDLYTVLLTKASDVSPYCDVNCKLEGLCKIVTTVLWERDRCETLKDLYFSK